jgi:hypothetical protein
MVAAVLLLLLLLCACAGGGAQGAVLPLGAGQALILASGNTPVTWTAPAGGCWANISLAGAGGGTYSIAPSGDGGAGAVFNVLAWLPPSSSVIAQAVAAGTGSLQGGPASAVYFGPTSGGGIIAVAGESKYYNN